MSVRCTGVRRWLGLFHLVSLAGLASLAAPAGLPPTLATRCWSALLRTPRFPLLVQPFVSFHVIQPPLQYFNLEAILFADFWVRRPQSRFVSINHSLDLTDGRSKRIHVLHLLRRQWWHLLTRNEKLCRSSSSETVSGRVFSTRGNTFVFMSSPVAKPTQSSHLTAEFIDIKRIWSLGTGSCFSVSTPSIHSQ